MNKKIIANKINQSNVFYNMLGESAKYGILVGLILVVIVLGFMSDYFFTERNLVNVLRQSSAQTIAAVGMTFVLILAGIDLSVGSVAVLVGTLSAGFIMNNHLSPMLAIFLAIVCGGLIGGVTGTIIAKLKIPSFIITLAMMSAARGLSLVYSGGYPISGLPNFYIFLGRGYIVGIPVSVIFMVIFVIIGWIVLNYTKFGRYVYAVGGNEEAARLSGVNVTLIKILTYTISALCASMTGVLMTARLASSQPTLGQGLELDVIAAVVLGGTSLFGGRGTIFGTVLGSLFLAIIANGLNLIGVSSFWQMIVKGVVLILAVILYEQGRSRSN